MRDLSLHMLDIVQNSVRAEASLVTIQITIDQERDRLTVGIVDDGCGMSEEMVRQVTSPFVTTRTTRSVGLGIPMLKNNAEQSGGDFQITSALGYGTRIEAVFGYRNIDRPPLGDIVGTMLALIAATPEKPDYQLVYTINEAVFTFDLRTIRQSLEGVPLNTPEVLQWIREYLQEGIDEITPEQIESMEGMKA